MRNSLLMLLFFGFLQASYAFAGINGISFYKKFSDIDKDIRIDQYGKVSAIVVINSKGQKLFEQYYGFTNKYTLNQISSVTKSITSIAVGICIDKGLIESIEKPIYIYFPEHEETFKKQPLFKQITIKHLLNQTTGLKWNEWLFPYNYASNSLIALLEEKKNWLDRFFSLSFDTIPGTKFNYNSLSSQVLAEIVSRVSGKPFNNFVDNHIFKPLRIENFHWDQYPNNPYPAWGGISLSTYDMAKIGLLLLNEGTFSGNYIVSSKWTNESSKLNIKIDSSTGYGLHWWKLLENDKPAMYYAAGYGDQYVFVVPSKDIIVAISSKNFTDYRWPKSVIDLAKSIVKKI